jgi:hypothetical protein
VTEEGVRGLITLPLQAGATQSEVHVDLAPWGEGATLKVVAIERGKTLPIGAWAIEEQVAQLP